VWTLLEMRIKLDVLAPKQRARQLGGPAMVELN
jgi:hypothetical protein